MNFFSVKMSVFHGLIPFLPIGPVSPGTPELFLKSSRTCLPRLETQALLHRTELLWPEVWRQGHWDLHALPAVSHSH